MRLRSSKNRPGRCRPETWRANQREPPQVNRSKVPGTASLSGPGMTRFVGAMKSTGVIRLAQSRGVSSSVIINPECRARSFRSPGAPVLDDLGDLILFVRGELAELPEERLLAHLIVSPSRAVEKIVGRYAESMGYAVQLFRGGLSGVPVLQFACFA